MSAFPISPTRRSILARLETSLEEFTNVSPENGAFLHLLTQALGATRVLEVGTSNGYSTLHFGMAVEGRGGRVVTIEAGLDPVIELQEGDAMALLESLEGEWDLAFLDAEKSEYRRYAQAIVPRLRPGELLLADDARSLRHLMPDFVEWAYSDPAVESCDASIDDGILLCWKRA